MLEALYYHAKIGGDRISPAVGAAKNVDFLFVCLSISLALSLIRRSKEKNFIIFSDSMSSLEAISGFKLEIDIVRNITKDYTHLANTGKAIILCWIPSHVNIRGNERADTAAKSALSLPITNMHEASST